LKQKLYNIIKFLLKNKLLECQYLCELEMPGFGECLSYELSQCFISFSQKLIRSKLLTSVGKHAWS